MIAAWTVLLPLTGAALSFLAGGRGARALAVLSGVGTTTAVALLSTEVWRHGPAHHPVGGWGAPLGIRLYADGLSAGMLLTSAVIGTAITVYALGYFRESREGGGWNPGESFWPLLLFLWAALNVLFLSADLFNLYVGLELMTLSAVALVLLAEDRAGLEAGMRYLLAALLGSLLYLLGVALLYARFHVLDVALLAQAVEAGGVARAALVLITVGLALKAALFPLHFWLPGAHSIAPAPVSAALSALVVSAAYYVLIRVWFGVLHAVVTYPAAQFMGVLGALAIVWGSLQAIRQQRLKVMIAYSTVAQMGYLFLLLPLAASPIAGGGASPWASQAWGGALYHTVTHALAKGAMFLAAGCVMQALRDDRIVGISGIAAHLPVATAAFGIAGITLVGVPPTGGFVAKWLFLTAALGTGQWWWTGILLLGGMLTAGYVFQVLTQELSRAEVDHQPRFAPVPRVMEYTTMALALAALLLGLHASAPLHLLEIGSPFARPLGGGE